MKLSPFVAFAVLTLAPAAVFAADGKPAEKTAEAPKRHPLRGVITGVLAEKSSILVKHEDIPGVMRAMTMAFKVDAATLQSVREGQAITGLLAREADGWHLYDVKPAAPKPAK